MPVSTFFLSFRLLQSDSLFNFYILCLCCAHAFNGLANVWEVHFMKRSLNEIRFDVYDEITNNALFYGAVSKFSARDRDSFHR